MVKPSEIKTCGNCVHISDKRERTLWYDEDRIMWVCWIAREATFRERTGCPLWDSAIAESVKLAQRQTEG